MIREINWVDICAAIVLLRALYVSVRNGLVVELFKLTGTVLAVYLSFHYYTVFSDAMAGRLPVLGEKIPLRFLDFLSFLILAASGNLVFVALRIVFYRFIHLDAAIELNRWGGLILGLARGVLYAGLIIFMLLISSISYFNKSVNNSYVGRELIKLAVSTYKGLWDNLGSRLAPGEKFNNTILEVQNGAI